MNTTLLWMGLAKALFGILVGAGAIFVAAKGLHRLLGSGETDAQTREGNVAVGVLKASSLIALGLLMQHAVSATFDAMDLLYRDAAPSFRAAKVLAVYALVHVGLSSFVSAVVLALGSYLFTRLTRGVDEMKEIREGNVAPALVLGAVMVVLALMTAPGLRMALDGLLPLPELGRDTFIAPS